MLAAQLKGKLKVEEERLEDLLTSNVFGSFKYVEPEEGLLLFLKKATTDDGKLLTELPRIARCDYDFWPKLRFTTKCEPDVVIRITHEVHSLTIIMIESKYLSGKSSTPSQGEFLSDQLAIEWDNLQYILQNNKATRGYLLYVTADYVMPKKEIEESQKELETKSGKRGNIAWVSWRVLPQLLEQTKQKILIDLRQLLLTQGLDFFRGVKASMDNSKKVNWSFVVVKEKSFQWRFTPLKVNWGFQKIENSFNLNVNIIFSDWRFNG